MAERQRQQTILVVGASGATGRLLVDQLLQSDRKVKALVRSIDGLPESLRDHPCLTVVQGDLLGLDAAALRRLTADCDAIASCLGHRVSWKGIFGPPYRLVTEATRRLIHASKAQTHPDPVRFVLMNSAGNRNRDLAEPLTPAHRFVVGLIRLLIPPHADNEDAADLLRVDFARRDETLEWCVVRPDTLHDDNGPSGYRLFESPTRSAIFDPGTTSRLNVARFMADLLTDDALWRRWRGRMPVVYDAD